MSKLSENQDQLGAEIKEQLDLFYNTSVVSGSDRDKYSSTIELYDSIPKLTFERLPVIDGARTLKTVTRTFKYRTKMYNVQLIPGSINCGNGERKEFYLTKREEIVENMLIKLAVDGCAALVDNELIIFFTLYQLEKELKKHGHGYSRAEIREAIQILGTSQFILSSEDNSESYKGNFITDIGTSTKNVIGEENQKMYVKFNSLMSKAIKQKQTRIINFDVLMKHKSLLARILVKRISHIFTQANTINPYKIKASTIIRDTGMTSGSRFRDTIRKIDKAWSEIEKNGLLLKYSKNIIYDKDDSRKIKDVLYIVNLSQKFVNDILIANRVSGHEKLEALPDKSSSDITQKLQKDFNLSSKEARIIVDNYQLQRIVSNADYVNNYKNEVGNKKAFLKAALADDYAGSDKQKTEPELEEKAEVIKVTHENKCYSKKEEKGFLKFIETIKSRLGESEYNNWFPSLALEKHSNTAYILSVKGVFQRDWVERSYMHLLTEVYQELYGKNTAIIIQNSLDYKEE